MIWTVFGIIVGVLLDIFLAAYSVKDNIKKLDTSDRTIKKTHKLFFLYDYEEEEKYLREMHRSGWKLLYIVMYTYVFEKTEPEDVVYRLDFQSDRSQDKAEYLQMFKDYGWEYIQDINDFSYFRMPAKGVSEEETEIFCDDISKLELADRVAKYRLFPVMTTFTAAAISNFIRLLCEYLNKPAHSVTYTIMFTVCTIITLFITTIYIMVIVKYIKKKRKYKKRNLK